MVGKQVRALVVVAALMLMGQRAGWSQASWEGPTGVFLNPLATTVDKGKWQGSVHYLDLVPLGSLTTVGVAYGVTPSVEAGVTRSALAVGSNANFDTFHAKWVAVHPKKGSLLPAVALGGLYRKNENGKDSSDVYLAATKIVPTTVPVIASLTVRNTDGAWSGLLGQVPKRTTQLGGFLGVALAGGKLILGAEYYEQPNARAWQDVAFRWSVGPQTNIDGGIADLSKTLNTQFAVAVSHKW